MSSLQQYPSSSQLAGMGAENVLAAAMYASSKLPAFLAGYQSALSYSSDLDRILSDAAYAAGWKKGVSDLRIRQQLDAEEDRRLAYRDARRPTF